jgi:hypothetical protein
MHCSNTPFAYFVSVGAATGRKRLQKITKDWIGFECIHFG